MNCTGNFDILGFYKKALSPEEMRRTAEHISSCEACRSQLEWHRSISGAMSSTEIEPSIDFEMRVSEALQNTLRERNMDDEREFILKSAPPAPSGLQLAKARLFNLIARKPALFATAAAFLLLLTGAIVFKDYITMVTGPDRVENPDDYPIEPADIDIVFGTTEWRDSVPLGTTNDDINASEFIMEQLAYGPSEYVQDDVELPYEPPNIVFFPRDEKFREAMQSFVADRNMKNMVFAYIAPQRIDLRAAFVQTEPGKKVDFAELNALKWLAKVQDPATGRWAAEAFGGEAQYTPGVTGLALMSFTGAGQTHASGEFKDTVGKAIDYLLGIQVKTGNHAGLLSQIQGNYMYNHGIATLALLDAYSMTGDARLVEPLKLAVELTCKAQNQYGAWGYQLASTTTDTSVSAWQIMSLRYGEAMGFGEKSKECILKAKNWLDVVTDMGTGMVGYRERGNYPNGAFALTAAGMFTRQIMSGADAEKYLLQVQESVLMEKMPAPHDAKNPLETDYYYLFFGSLAMYQQGGDNWAEWGGQLDKTLIDAQTKSGENAGSWAPADRWGEYGGRIYSTAMAVLSLESHFRYPNLRR